MTIAGRTDEELAVSAQHGCTDSCEELLTRLRPSLVRYLEVRTGRLDLAEDLTQETLLRAVQKLHQYKRQHKVRSWLFTIARRIGVRRSLRPWITHERPGEVWRKAQGRPEDPLIADESAHRFWCQLAVRLTLDDLIGLWLVHTDRLSLAHVGRLLGLAPSTIKMRMFRARRKLRQQMPHRSPADRSECR
ncbi:MAG: sigma-70 family RNA polymerase sigma factor [Pirellulales bacterium]